MVVAHMVVRQLQSQLHCPFLKRNRPMAETLLTPLFYQLLNKTRNHHMAVARMVAVLSILHFYQLLNKTRSHRMVAVHMAATLSTPQLLTPQLLIPQLLNKTHNHHMVAVRMVATLSIPQFYQL